MRRRPAQLIFAALTVLLHATAWAGLDVYGLGDGSDGPLVIRDGGVTINSYTDLSQPAPAGSTTLSVASTAAFSNDDLILIHTAGAHPNLPSGAPDAGALDITGTAVGQFELARVVTIQNGRLTLDAPLERSYPTSTTQVVRVPEYTSVEVQSGSSIDPNDWNGNVGGIVAFLAQGTVTNNGRIEANLSGFRFGSYVNGVSATGCSSLDEPSPDGGRKGEGVITSAFGVSSSGYGNLANAGGGGVCHNSGGGGGGNGGPGGRGGRTPESDSAREVGGVGGSKLLHEGTLHRLTFGGGGGAGHGNGGNGTSGDRGGGVVFIRGGGLTGNGTISANGGSADNASSDGAGGGGAGGTLYLRFAGAIDCGAIEARGGRGGNTSGTAHHGPGGGGGAGAAFIQGVRASSCAVRVLPGLAGTSSAGGNSHATFGPSYGAEPTTTSNPAFGGVLEQVDAGFRLPDVPSLTAPADGEWTSQARPAINGVTTPGATVWMELDGAAWASAQTDESGAFSVTPVSDLSLGTHTVRARAELYAAWSAFSPVHTFQVVPPSPTIVSPAMGESVSTQAPTFVGTAAPQLTVRLQLDGALLAEVTPDGAGNWEYAVPTSSPLAFGAHSLSATAVAQGTHLSLPAQVEFVVGVPGHDGGISSGDGGVSGGGGVIPGAPTVTIGCACGSAGSALAGWAFAVALLAVNALRRRARR